VTPARAHAVYRRLVLFDMPGDIKLGLRLAFLRTLGIESIGSLLLSTGETTQRTRRRADDTGLLMYTLFYFGFDEPDGVTAMHRLRRIHQRFVIANDDMLYVLACLAVVPTRFADRHGRRRLTAVERSATFGFYRELGDRLGITGIPGDYDQLEAWFDTYDRTHLVAHPAATALLDANRKLLVEKLPRWSRRLADRCAGAILDDRLRQALGVARPAVAARATVAVFLRVRRWAARMRGPAAEAAFTPGAATGSYPHGYQVARVGPADSDAETSPTR